MGLLTTPERLSYLLVDCHESILKAFFYTVKSVDLSERPCWVISPEDASFPNVGTEQEQIEQSYRVEYIGEVFDAGEDYEYELQARQVAEAATLYLLRHPNLQMSNERGLFDSKMPGLNGVLRMKLDSRSAVSLASKEGVDGEQFWGFAINLSIVEQIDYEIANIAN